MDELLRLIYGHPAQPFAAARWLKQHPDALPPDPYIACAIGNLTLVQQTLAADRGWAGRTGGPLHLPPLVAVTHSSLCRLPQFRDRLRTCAGLLLDHGANPNAATGRLTALYGAVGINGDLEMAQLLLAAGANPDDGECLYHSLVNPDITRLLLEAGVPIAPNNALYHAMDFSDPTPLMVLLQFGADANQPPLGPPTSWFGSPLLWAIRRRVSIIHYEALLSAGADTRTRTPNGISTFQLARRYGLPDVARLLVQWGAPDDPGSLQEQFLGDCGCAQEVDAQRKLVHHPDLIRNLSASELGLLPELIAGEAHEAPRVMVRLGWPLDARGGDWQATALNMAVYQGNSELCQFLLERGASWTETHGFNSNVAGTLSWACRNRPTPDGDYVSCASVLLESGMPRGQRDPAQPGGLVIAGQFHPYTEDVIEALT